MFSGIVEETARLTNLEAGHSTIRIKLERPNQFDDISVGDSIAVNGVCLTIESFDEKTISFALAAETIKIIDLKLSKVNSLLENTEKIKAHPYFSKKFNLERSLKFGDRIHGHLVTGHVEGISKLIAKKYEGESLFLDFHTPTELTPYLWRKGSITLNGISLTVNEFKDNVVSVCIIPETQAKTNIATLDVGDFVTVEPDYFAKTMVHQFNLRNEFLSEEKNSAIKSFVTKPVEGP